MPCPAYNQCFCCTVSLSDLSALPCCVPTRPLASRCRNSSLPTPPLQEVLDAVEDVPYLGDIAGFISTVAGILDDQATPAISDVYALSKDFTAK